MGHSQLRLATALVVLLTNCSVPYFTVHAQSYCDASLVGMTSSELGYRDRGNRCEGLYIEKVGGTTLLLASFTESFEQYDSRSGKPIRIEWNRPLGNSTVRVRAQGLNSRLYYRMDTVQPAGSTSYTWPSHVLASLNIGANDIGVLGSTKRAVGQTERDIYLPVRISQAGRAIRKGSYQLIILPGVELQEMFITLATTQADGQPAKFIKDGEKLGYGFYPAERRIEIPVTGLTNPGTYYLHIGATIKSGGSATIEFWFEHSNR